VSSTGTTIVGTFNGRGGFYWMPTRDSTSAQSLTPGTRSDRGWPRAYMTAANINTLTRRLGRFMIFLTILGTMTTDSEPGNP
jgi:hypothetical protein